VSPVLSLLMAGACQPGLPPPRALGARPVDLITSAPPIGVDLGTDLAVAAFRPGHYATAVVRATHGTHALQVLSEDASSALVLDLASDGRATACRGWRYDAHNDGPTVHTEEHLREQQGYAGRYTVVDGVAHLDLHIDDDVCPQIREHGSRGARRSAKLVLRCVLAEPRRRSALPAPALLCALRASGASPELEAQRVPDLAPDPWIVLGSGDGLRVKVPGMPPGARAGEPSQVEVIRSSEPVGFDVSEARE